MVTSQGDRLEQEQNQMKKDLAEVKAYAEAMADSNRARDAYVDKEQDTLGAEGVLPRGQIEGLLRVFKQYTLNLPTG